MVVMAVTAVRLLIPLFLEAVGVLAVRAVKEV
jgi:hypothetical protein